MENFNENIYIKDTRLCKDLIGQDLAIIKELENNLLKHKNVYIQEVIKLTAHNNINMNNVFILKDFINKAMPKYNFNQYIDTFFNFSIKIGTIEYFLELFYVYKKGILKNILLKEFNDENAIDDFLEKVDVHEYLTLSNIIERFKIEVDGEYYNKVIESLKNDRERLKKNHSIIEKEEYDKCINLGIEEEVLSILETKIKRSLDKILDVNIPTQKKKKNIYVSSINSNVNDLIDRTAREFAESTFENRKNLILNNIDALKPYLDKKFNLKEYTFDKHVIEALKEYYQKLLSVNYYNVYKNIIIDFINTGVLRFMSCDELLISCDNIDGALNLSKVIEWGSHRAYEISNDSFNILIYKSVKELLINLRAVKYDSTISSEELDNIIKIIKNEIFNENFKFTSSEKLLDEVFETLINKYIEYIQYM